MFAVFPLSDFKSKYLPFSEAAAQQASSSQSPSSLGHGNYKGFLKIGFDFCKQEVLKQSHVRCRVKKLNLCMAENN